MSRIILVFAAALLSTACEREAQRPVEAPQPPAVVAESSRVEVGTLIDSALAGTHRSDANRSRDGWRNPKETLTFFGLRPGMTVVEVFPGGGWYTEVLAPVLHDEGQLVAVLTTPDASDYARRTYDAYNGKLAESPGVYGNVAIVTTVTGEGMTLGESGSADMVLTFRNMHSFNNAGALGHFFAAAFDVLKPGGTLGVVTHRADEGVDPVETSPDGYLPESYIIAHAEAAGFTLDTRSDINANPADTKDHERGVWTLPPALRLGDTDRDRYEAIGESDRMTLKFRKD